MNCDSELFLFENTTDYIYPNYKKKNIIAIGHDNYQFDQNDHEYMTVDYKALKHINRDLKKNINDSNLAHVRNSLITKELDLIKSNRLQSREIQEPALDVTFKSERIKIPCDNYNTPYNHAHDDGTANATKDLIKLRLVEGITKEKLNAVEEDRLIWEKENGEKVKRRTGLGIHFDLINNNSINLQNPKTFMMMKAPANESIYSNSLNTKGSDYLSISSNYNRILNSSLNASKTTHSMNNTTMEYPDVLNHYFYRLAEKKRQIVELSEKLQEAQQNYQIMERNSPILGFSPQLSNFPNSSTSNSPLVHLENLEDMFTFESPKLNLNLFGEHFGNDSNDHFKSGKVNIYLSNTPPQTSHSPMADPTLAPNCLSSIPHPIYTALNPPPSVPSKSNASAYPKTNSKNSRDLSNAEAKPKENELIRSISILIKTFLRSLLSRFRSLSLSCKSILRTKNNSSDKYNSHNIDINNN